MLVWQRDGHAGGVVHGEERGVVHRVGALQQRAPRAQPGHGGRLHSQRLPRPVRGKLLLRYTNVTLLVVTTLPVLHKRHTHGGRLHSQRLPRPVPEWVNGVIQGTCGMI